MNACDNLHGPVYDDQDGDDTGVRVPVYDEIDTDQAHDGDAHVQAPRDEGGGHARAVDVCQDVVPAVDNEDQHEVSSDNTGGEEDDDKPEDDNKVLHDQANGDPGDDAINKQDGDKPYNQPIEDEGGGDGRVPQYEETLHGQVHDDTGGDDDTPDGSANTDVTAKEMTTKKDMAIPNDTEGGEAVPTPDDIEAGSLRCQMTKKRNFGQEGREA